MGDVLVLACDGRSVKLPGGRNFKMPKDFSILAAGSKFKLLHRGKHRYTGTLHGCLVQTPRIK